MAEGLKIQIGADVSQAIGGLKQVETAMQKTVSNSKAFEASVGKSGQALGKIVNPSNQATLALTNLGRVAQDAPFGFLGIANNLNPLLESFQRLKATTGSTGGALKALGKSLTGAGGVGLALSVVSGLAVIFGDKLFGTGRAAKAAKEETNQLAESVAKSLVTLTSLVGIVKNVNSSNEDRVKALKAINEQYAKYIPNLEKEGITANNIALAYDTITEALLRQAVVKGLQAEIQKEVEATAGKIIKLTKEQERLRLESDKSVKPVYEKIAADKILQRGQESLTKATTDGFIAQQKQSQATKAQIGSTNVLGQVINKLKEDLKETLKPLLNLTTSFDDLDVSIKEVKVKPKKITIDEQLAVKSVLDKPLRISATFKIEKLFEEDKKDPREYFDRFKDLKIFDRPIVQPVKINIAPDVIEGMKKAREELDRMLEDARFVAGTISNAFGQAFDQIASGKNVFEALGQALKQVVIDLIKAALQALIFRAIISAVPGGAAVSGLNSGLSAAFGGFRAKGGGVDTGKAYIVGERGPEIFAPSVSGSIIPNNQISSFSGRTQMATVRVTGRLRGNDMILQNARTNRMQTRLG